MVSCCSAESPLYPMLPQAARANALSAAQGFGDRLSFGVGDALAMPFDDGQFDLVWSMESGEHMPDKRWGWEGSGAGRLIRSARLAARPWVGAVGGWAVGWGQWGGAVGGGSGWGQWGGAVGGGVAGGLVGTCCAAACRAEGGAGDEVPEQRK